MDKGFALEIGPSPRVLVLGSMPSQKSLEKVEYYGHPQNAFWKIMIRYFDLDKDLDYQSRLKHVLDSGIAIWDVIQSCERPGSMDADIVKETIVVNEIEELTRKEPSIKAILLNGGTAETTFKKHLSKENFIKRGIKLEKMPSTSPAYAKMSLDDKYKIWSRVLDQNLNS